MQFDVLGYPPAWINKLGRLLYSRASFFCSFFTDFG
jgi:hypothetical protein